ncbi:hypothetical protein ACYPKM_02330 [Pseudomonas aeruginosa]
MATRIPCKALLALCNPYGTKWPWGCVVHKKDVEKALSEGRLVDQPGTFDHAGRIAYLVANRDENPINIDVGIPSIGFIGPVWPITDGNHRFGAALFRGDEHINADIDGSLDRACELFGIEAQNA